MNRNTFFDFKNRIGRNYWGRQNKKGIDFLYDGIYVYWDSELFNADGAHYHFWIPSRLKNDPVRKEYFLNKCEAAARNLGDVVMLSYDYHD